MGFSLGLEETVRPAGQCWATTYPPVPQVAQHLGLSNPDHLGPTQSEAWKQIIRIINETRKLETVSRDGFACWKSASQNKCSASQVTSVVCRSNSMTCSLWIRPGVLLTELFREWKALMRWLSWTVTWKSETRRVIFIIGSSRCKVTWLTSARRPVSYYLNPLENMTWMKKLVQKEQYLFTLLQPMGCGLLRSASDVQ